MAETKDMFEQISAILTDKKDKPLSYEELAAMLKTDPDALKTLKGCPQRKINLILLEPPSGGSFFFCQKLRPDV